MPHSSQDFYNQVLGGAGENKATEYLKKQGCKILYRNFKTPFGEADIVMQDGEDVVFVEVKTRTNDRYSTPGSAVDKRKQKHYRNIARFYLAGIGHDIFIRFDVLEIYNGTVNWLKNAFY